MNIKPKDIKKMTLEERLELMALASMNVLASINKKNEWLNKLALEDPKLYIQFMMQTLKMQLEADRNKDVSKVSDEKPAINIYFVKPDKVE